MGHEQSTPLKISCAVNASLPTRIETSLRYIKRVFSQHCWLHNNSADYEEQGCNMSLCWSPGSIFCQLKYMSVRLVWDCPSVYIWASLLHMQKAVCGMSRMQNTLHLWNLVGKQNPDDVLHLQGFWSKETMDILLSRPLGQKSRLFKELNSNWNHENYGSKCFLVSKNTWVRVCSNTHTCIFALDHLSTFITYFLYLA